MTIEWSADGGKTWRPITVMATSPILVYLRNGQYADGVGNVYRHRSTA